MSISQVWLPTWLSTYSILHVKVSKASGHPPPPQKKDRTSWISVQNPVFNMGSLAVFKQFERPKKAAKSAKAALTSGAAARGPWEIQLRSLEVFK